MNRLLGVVLCGGQSSRMGRDKAHLRHSSGGTYLELAVGRLRNVCDAVCLSGGASNAPTDAGLKDIPWVPDRVKHQGPAAGVAAALGWARETGHAGCLVTPVDTPNLTPADLQSLRDRWLEGSSAIVCALDAERDRLQPLIAIYPVRLRAAIEELSQSGDRSLRRWLLTQSYEAVAVPPVSLHNINRPEDLGDVREPPL